MEVESWSDFLQNCCRVCLAVESKMVESSNIVEDFNKSIDLLLFECANMKQSNDIIHPKKLCEDCTAELVMVAKFREKCDMSAVALDRLRQQINKICKPVTINHENTDAKDSDSNSNQYYDQLEYTEENVEYVIYDSGTEFIEEADITDRPQEISKSDDIDTQNNQSITYTSSETITNETTSIAFKKIKSNNGGEHKSATKSLIKYHCKVCGAGFAQSNNYTKHLQTHNDLEFNIVSEDDSFRIEMSSEESEPQDDCKVSATSSMQPHGKCKKSLQKNHTCQYCGRPFPSVSLLATHTRIHTGERPFKCGVCSKTFKTQGALDLHSRRHSGIKPYSCTVCNRGFVESSNLKVHMRSHTGEKPHQCVTCGRSFSRVFLLQIHQRTHTGEKPYACDTCKKSFAQQGDLAAHKRIHSGERPHQCKICQKGFIKSSGLTQHMRRHFRTAKKHTNQTCESLEENEQIEIIGVKQNSDAKAEQLLICFKEYNENSQTFDEYLEQ